MADDKKTSPTPVNPDADLERLQQGGLGGAGAASLFSPPPMPQPTLDPTIMQRLQDMLFGIPGLGGEMAQFQQGPMQLPPKPQQGQMPLPPSPGMPLPQ
jgi:hypothetical protein